MTNSSQLHRVSQYFKGGLENLFYRLGVLVASKSKAVILATLVITLIFGSGLIFLREETRPDKLILPAKSDYAVNIDWLRSHAAFPFRENYAGITAENVLTPEVIKILLDLHETVRTEVVTSSGKKWEDLCFKAPITKFGIGEEHLSRKRRDTSSEDPFSDSFFDEDNDIESNVSKAVGRKWQEYHAMSESLYCSIIEELDEACLEFNPAELWAFDERKIRNLSIEEVIRVYNHESISPVFGRVTGYKLELGGEITKNEKGEIVGATSLLLKWEIKVDSNQELVTDSQGMVGNKEGVEWEQRWIKVMQEFAEQMPPGIKLYFANAACWGDILDKTIWDEGFRVGYGFIVMIFYVGFMLGKFNMVEQRSLLTLAGVGSIGLSLIASCGLFAYLSIPFMILTRVLPLLILGIGIDDIFVITQTWKNLERTTFKTKKAIPLEERIGITLKHSGVSITVTSVTDVIAFTAGSLTTIPTLRNFCIYAAVGIFVLFIYQCTFFVACFALDQRRLEEGRNGLFPWIKYEDHSVETDDSPSLLELFFQKFLAPCLLAKGSKVAMLLLTGCLLGGGIYGNTLLRQHSDPLWFIPSDSYFSQFFSMHINNYPGKGLPGVVVVDGVDWPKSLKVFGEFVEEIERTPVIYEMHQFYTPLREFLMDSYNIDLTDDSVQLDEKTFNKYMGRFLFSPYGAKFRYFFKFNGNFTCGKTMPEIETVVVPFIFKYFHEGAVEHIPAMNKIKSLVKNATERVTFNSADSTLFFWAQISISWELDEIVKGELYRNLAISLCCVLLATLILLADFRLCVMCGLCVICTVINVCGYMHFWNLTIDSTACVILVLAVGLCVDYAAHICLSFTEHRNMSKNMKARKALESLGPAVFNGGFSTFLGVSLVVTAKTVAAHSFFKIFTLVVAFGLYHGLLFLPVLLSYFGPNDSVKEDTTIGRRDEELMLGTTSEEVNKPRVLQRQAETIPSPS